MDETFNFKILGLNKVIYENDVERVVLNGIDGEFTILKDFHNFLGITKEGEIKILKDSKEEIYNLKGGILEFKDNNLNLLVNG